MEAVLKSDLRILIVDDFPTMRRIIRNLLRELGYQRIEDAEDGDSGLAALRKGSFDLLITDWNMPGLSGVELLKSVRADETLEHLPVLMVTAEAKRDNIIEAAQSGVNGYIVKPFTAEVLEQKIDKIFEDHPA